MEDLQLVSYAELLQRMARFEGVVLMGFTRSLKLDWGQISTVGNIIEQSTEQLIKNIERQGKNMNNPWNKTIEMLGARA